MKTKEDNTRIQRHIRNWTAAMAVGAFLATGFTLWYVFITKSILMQARVDSKMEYRPYLAATEHIVGEVEKSLSSGDTIAFKQKVKIVFSNSGKTPALNLRSNSSIDQIKIRGQDFWDDRWKSATEVPVSGTVPNGTNRGSEKILTLFIPVNCQVGDRGRLEVEGAGSFVFKVYDLRKTSLYYHCAYLYSEIREDNIYKGWITLFIDFDVSAGSLKIGMDKAYMD